jgi:uncharacterized protein YbjT (DUF2867 family)
MNLLVTGATGLAGAEVVREALRTRSIGSVTALVRRPMPFSDPTLTTVIHGNFLDYSGLDGLFKSVDACAWCLGISQSQVGRDEYAVITHDFALAAAAAMHRANPDLFFLFLSGHGADPTGRSRTLFERVKGKTENDLMKIGFKKLAIVRPAGIRPVNKNPNAALANRIMGPLWPLMGLVAPSFVIRSTELARAMLYILAHGTEKTILDRFDLRRIAERLEAIRPN